MTWLLMSVFVSCAIIDVSGQVVNTKLDKKIGEICAETINNNMNLFLPGFVRIAFHDCIDGCDGCVDTNSDVNAGLAPAVNGSLEVYEEQVKALGVSVADFWAKCGQVAAEAGRRNALGQSFSTANDLGIKMRYGRKDCTGNHVAKEELFPNSHWGHKDLIGFCSDRFSLTRKECVALMGGHTLGRAIATGWRGQWVAGESVLALNNEYFINMVKLQNWTQVNVGRNGVDRWQYESSGLMMLNCDISNLKNINPDETGEAEQTLDDVSFSNTASLVRRYASNNRLWLSDFGKAFTKMIENGSNNLRNVRGGPAKIPETSDEFALPPCGLKTAQSEKCQSDFVSWL